MYTYVILSNSARVLKIDHGVGAEEPSLKDIVKELVELKELLSTEEQTVIADVVEHPTHLVQTGGDLWVYGKV
jgi:hypothetical protein